MNEHDMAASEPLKRTEIKKAQEALEIVEKCRSTMVRVVNEVNATFKANLKTKCDLTRPTGKSWGIQTYLPKYARGPVRWVGCTLEPRGGGLYFDVWMTGTRHPKMEKIRRDLGWQELTEESGCYSSVKLRGDRRDLDRMVAHAKHASHELGRAIRKLA